LTALNSSLSSPQGRKPRTLRPPQWLCVWIWAVNSSTLRLSSTLASAFSNRSLAFCDTSGPPLQVGDSLPHAAPLQTLGRTSLFGPVGKQALHGVDGGLPGAQHIAPATVRLVVKFGGVAIHLVLDAYAFLPAFHVRFQRPAEVRRDLSGLVDRTAEVAHRIRAGQAEHAVPHQQRHQPSQKLRPSESDI